MAVASLSDPALAGLRADVRTFLDADVEAGRFVPYCDAWMSQADAAYSRRLAARGWVGMTIPTAYGGPGRTALERFVVVEELLAAGAPVAAHWITDRQVAGALLRFGSEEQRQRYLPGIARAEEIVAIGMSEPEAGSDLAGVATRGVPDGDRWRLRGRKVWTTNAHRATAMVVLARTRPLGEDRHAGLTQFLVPLPYDGVTISPIRALDGHHDFNEVVFDDVLLGAEHVLGQPGDGWRQVTAELATERSGPERIMSAAPLLRAWARDVAAGRTTPSGPEEVGRLGARLTVLRRLSFAVAVALDAGRRPEVEAALVKDLGTRFEADVVETVRRTTCPEDRSAEVARLLEHVVLQTPAFTLRGGTNEVLRSVVARGLALR
jgi:alkylation response protein AidB-like acyl-CoA dehydrogenase